MDWEPLIAAALGARERAYAPFSGYRVGAALSTAEGAIVAGANVENRSFGLSICAERSAVVAAVAAGHRSFTAAVVVTESSPPAAPCGLCRETLAEFARSLPILLVNPQGERRLVDLAELLPMPFEWHPHANPREERP